MSNLPKRKSAKILALVLSLLITFQGVVYASPDITYQNTLAPESGFAAVNRAEEVPRHMMFYICKSIFNELEQDSKNYTVAAMQKAIEELIAGLEALDRDNLPKGLVKVVASGDGSSVSISFKPGTIRFYNPRIKGSEKPNFPCKIVNERQLSERLFRHIVFPQPAISAETQLTTEAFLRVYEAVKGAFPEVTILPTFSSLAVDTSVDGNDKNREAALNLFYRQGIYMEIPEGQDENRDKLGYEWFIMPMIVPKESIPPELLEKIKGKEEKQVSEGTSAYLGEILDKAGVKIIEKQVRSHKLNSEEPGYIAFDAKSAIAVLTGEGDLMVQAHFWAKRDFQAMEFLNRRINSEHALRSFEIKEDLSQIEVTDSETALDALARYSWYFFKEFINEEYESVDLLRQIIDKITPESLIDTKGIGYDRHLGVFVSKEDENGLGKHLENFLASLNSIQQLSALLYYLAVPQFDQDTQKGIPIDDKALQDSIIRFYYRMYKHLYDLGIDQFNDVAIFEPLRIEIGYYADRLNKAIRDDDALEVNDVSYRFPSYIDGFLTHLAHLAIKDVKLSDEEKFSLQKIYYAMQGEKWAYDILQLAESLEEENFVNAFRYLKTDNPPVVLPSEKPYEAFDGRGRIATLGLALRFAFDIDSEESGYEPKYLVRTRKLKDDNKLQSAEEDIVREMFSDDVIRTSKKTIKTPSGESVEIWRLMEEKRLTFKAGDKILKAKQDFKITEPVECVYPVKIILDDKEIGKIYVVDMKDFRTRMEARNLKRDNVPRPWIVTDKDRDIYFGSLTDATPGGVWIGDGVMEQLLKPDDYNEMTAWQMTAMELLPESGEKTLERLISVLEEIPGAKDEKLVRDIREMLDLRRPVGDIMAEITPVLYKLKKYYKEHETLSEEKIKTRILGGAEEELERLRELMTQIETLRLDEGKALVYLKAQITKKLLFPLSGGMHVFGRYIHKLPRARMSGARFLTPTSCSTNGEAYINLMFSIMFGGFGRYLLDVVATTLHMYTTGDKEGPFGHLKSKSTGAAKGVKQHIRINAMFTALRTGTALKEWGTAIVGGSEFDSLTRFPYPVEEDVIRAFVRRVGAESPEILKVFDSKDREGGKYLWEKTISGQSTGSILFPEYIEQITETIIRLPVGYDNEWSYSYKMTWELLSRIALAVKRQRDTRKRAGTSSPGFRHIRIGPNADKPLTEEENEATNRAIKDTIQLHQQLHQASKAVDRTFVELENGRTYLVEEDIVREADMYDEEGDTIGTFVIMQDGIYDAFARKNDAPLDVLCIPGTQRTREKYDFTRHEETYNLVEKRFYIRKSFYDSLNREQKLTVARREEGLIRYALGIVSLGPFETPEEWINSQEGSDVRPFVKEFERMKGIEAAAEEEKITLPSVKDIPLTGKRVVVRVDFNVPVDVEFGAEGEVANITITDDKRIRAALPTLLYILEQNPKSVILVTHFEPKVPFPDGRKKKIALSTKVISDRLYELLPDEHRDKILFLDDSVEKTGIAAGQEEEVISELERALEKVEAAPIVLLENIRFAEGEKKGDLELRKQLSSLADVYVVDAFGTVHREHASMLPTVETTKAAGFLVEDEFNNLSKAFLPERPLAAIFGGAKLEDKVRAIESFIESMREGDSLLIGGAAAYTFLRAKDESIALGNSLVQNDKVEWAKEMLKKAERKGIRVVLPVDHIIAAELLEDASSQGTGDKNIPRGYMGVDIGVKTQIEFLRILDKAKTVVWNGPLGAFEEKQGGFIEGTQAIAQVLRWSSDEGKTDVIIGGGDTATAIEKTGEIPAENMFVSTGGGATIEFLAEKGNLPVLNNLADAHLKVVKKAEKMMPILANALVAASSRDEKVVLALDLGLGKEETNACTRDLINFMSTLKEKNPDLAKALRNLEIIKGEGRDLASRVKNVTTLGKGSLDPRNVIVVAKSSSLIHYLDTGLEDTAVIAGIDDRKLPSNAYLPLLEVTLFALGKYLGWGEDTMREYYKMIPNAVSIEPGSEDDIIKFDVNKKFLIIILIPDAVRYDGKQHRDMIEILKDMLASA